MPVGINDSSSSLELAKSRQEAALKAKEKAEAAKADATLKDTEASADAEKKSQEANVATVKAAKENEEVKLAKENLNNANIRVSTSQQAYSNALRQLAIVQKSGDENSLEKAQEAVRRAFEQLKSAQQEAQKAQEEYNKESQEAQEAMNDAQTKKLAAEQALSAAELAKNELEKAEAALNSANIELEIAEAALKSAEEAEKANETENTEDVAATEGTEEAEHLSQEEIDKLVQEGYTYITSKEQFLEIFQGGEINLDGKYILGCDIDLSDVENWKSIGDSENPFTGIFDGNGYSINNLTINVEDSNAENVGFFGVTENAVIQNVDFINANVVTPEDFINGSSAVGIVVGTARGTEFDNINISGAVTGYESIGGLAGVIDDNSYATEDGRYVEVGNSSISNVSTAVDAQGKYFVGGLIGYVADTSTNEDVATRDLRINNCSTSGNIQFEEESAGGLIGEAGKTIITINNCESSVNITWNNSEDNSDLSFLMETGRAGGFIGCVNGTYVAICNSSYNGNLNVDGDFQGNWYGWYMNDAHVSIYELPGGLPIDDILNIDGIEGLTPITDPSTGVSRYEVTVSTLTGLDKMVTMIQNNPALADIITFNVNFDFEAMDGMYDPSIYAQYGVVQHQYEDEDGNVHNDVYIDNEIDLEETFHGTELIEITTEPVKEVVEQTMVSGLYKDFNGNYVVNTSDGFKDVNLKFNYEDQISNITKRLEADEVRYRDYITQMVLYYQDKMHDSLRELFGIDKEEELPVINKAEYKKLQKMMEAGVELTDEQKLAMAVYEVDYVVMNKVADVTKNYGCGMGGNASFLDETKAIHMKDEMGRPLYTTLAGDQLRQRMDENGNLMTDEDGNPIYENLDGSDYEGIAEVFAQRGYPVTDENGNFMYTDKEGNSVTKILDEDGNATYKNADGSDYEGAEEDLVQQLEPYNNAEEYTNLENEMKDLLEDVEAGKYPLDENENGESVNVAEESVQPEDVTPTSETSIPDESNSVDELEKEKIKKGLL